MAQATRRKVLITGAAGGMGRACARLFGLTQDLILTDVTAPSLEGFADELRREGLSVAGVHTGDLAEDGVLGELVARIRGDAAFTVLHTAGLSPALADWRAIMNVNLVATEKMLLAIEPVLTPGSVAVVIASVAGHLLAPVPDADTLMRTPLSEGFLDQIEPFVESIGTSVGGVSASSYMLSKRATLSLCERRAVAWGKQGARIVTISPGMILTPMGRQEMEKTPGAAQMAEMAPAGRTGTAADIAMAAHFLASDQADFITGCDLKVDGGATALVRTMMG